MTDSRRGSLASIAEIRIGLHLFLSPTDGTIILVDTRTICLREDIAGTGMTCVMLAASRQKLTKLEDSFLHTKCLNVIFVQTCLCPWNSTRFNRKKNRILNVNEWKYLYNITYSSLTQRHFKDNLLTIKRSQWTRIIVPLFIKNSLKIVITPTNIKLATSEIHGETRSKQGDEFYITRSWENVILWIKELAVIWN